MDSTIEYYLNLISSTTNPKDIRSYKRLVEKEISDYRFAAYKNPGTNVARICNRSANWIEQRLKRVLHSR